MPFGIWTRFGPRNHIRRVPDVHTWMDKFEEIRGQPRSQNIPRHVRRSTYSKRLSWDQNRRGADADWGRTRWGREIWLNRPCAAAMRPYVKLLWPRVCCVLWRVMSAAQKTVGIGCRFSSDRFNLLRAVAVVSRSSSWQSWQQYEEHCCSQLCSKHRSDLHLAGRYHSHSNLYL